MTNGDLGGVGREEVKVREKSVEEELSCLLLSYQMVCSREDSCAVAQLRI